MNERKKALWLAAVFSLLFHAALLFFLDFIDVLVINAEPVEEAQATEVEFIFPENRPQQEEQERLIVENRNFNEQKPDQTNLLSDRNSRARNPEKTDQTSPNNPMSEGTQQTPNLSSTQFKPPGWKPFSSKALTGKQVDEANNPSGEDRITEENEETTEASVGSPGTGRTSEQKKFSVEEVGALSLSTYAWAYAPYLNKLRIKHQNVWFTPAAYNRLGLISGRTRLYLEIDRQGNLITLEVLDHQGHESLLDASVNSIRSTFPFLPLPDDFPDEKLGITATLIYPDLRRR